MSDDFTRRRLEQMGGVPLNRPPTVEDLMAALGEAQEQIRTLGIELDEANKGRIISGQLLAAQVEAAGGELQIPLDEANAQAGAMLSVEERDGTVYVTVEERLPASPEGKEAHRGEG